MERKKVSRGGQGEGRSETMTQAGTGEGKGKDAGKRSEEELVKDHWTYRSRSLGMKVPPGVGLEIHQSDFACSGDCR